MEANETQDQTHLTLPPAGFQEYDLNSSGGGAAVPAVLPTLMLDGVNFLEDPIRLLSVQVQTLMTFTMSLK